MSLYLDHNATSPATAEHFHQIFDRWSRVGANPSSPHAAGRAASVALMDARKHVAQSVLVDPGEVVFVSGGSEANNLATLGVLRGLKQRFGNAPLHAITTAIEHPSVLEPLQLMRERDELQLTILPVDAEGRISLSQLIEAIQPHTALISVMVANNETGAIQPTKEFADWLHAARWSKIKPGQGWRSMQQEFWPGWAKNLNDEMTQEHLQKISFHVDAVQAYGKIPFSSWWSQGYDFASFCAHKLGGLTGVGALIARRGRQFEPLIWGGSQERARRAGTENLIGILSLADVAQRVQSSTWWIKIDELSQHRDQLSQEIALLPEVVLNSPQQGCLPNTVNFSVDGVSRCGEDLLIALDLRGLYASSGSACSSSANRPSHVVLAQSGDAVRARNAVRISMSPEVTAQDIAALSFALREIFNKS